MNNLVFNTTASELRTTLFAQAPGNEIKALQLDASDNLLVSVASGTMTVQGTVTVSEITAPVTIGNASLTVGGTVTVSEITAPVTIGNASLTVGGTVTVSEITAPVTIGNASLTVEGTVTVSEITAPVTIGNASLTVGGTVTVSEITAPVTIGNASLTVQGTITIGASTFTSDAVTSTSVSGTGVIFPDKDISTLKVASIFLYNEDTAPITISLQISPTTDDGLYMDDPSYTDQVIPGNESLYMAVSNFAHYIRLQYNLGGQTATFSAYYNAQA
ncbi:MAG: DUF6385 domain-containing protein [Candidatus Limiplasma sp.]|nr:DUF6385 domain-containing protein [Candidatus Limiplasma sp.]